MMWYEFSVSAVKMAYGTLKTAFVILQNWYMLYEKGLGNIVKRPVKVSEL